MIFDRTNKIKSIKNDNLNDDILNFKEIER